MTKMCIRDRTSATVITKGYFKFVRVFLERIPMPSGLLNASFFKFLLTASMFPSFTASKKEYSSESAR